MRLRNLEKVMDSRVPEEALLASKFYLGQKELLR